MWYKTTVYIFATVGKPKAAAGETVSTALNTVIVKISSIILLGVMAGDCLATCLPCKLTAKLQTDVRARQFMCRGDFDTSRIASTESRFLISVKLVLVSFLK